MSGYICDDCRMWVHDKELWQCTDKRCECTCNWDHEQRRAKNKLLTRRAIDEQEAVTEGKAENGMLLSELVELEKRRVARETRPNLLNLLGLVCSLAALGFWIWKHGL